MTMNPTWNAGPTMAAPSSAVANLLRSELRKITTTSVWWGLAIPALGLALLLSWGGAAVVTSLFNEINSNQILETIGARLGGLPYASFVLVRVINLMIVFPMVFGGLAMSTEVHRKTITTTYLTAPSRISVLSAKLTVYALVGLAYGLIIGGFASLGTWLGAVTVGHTDYLPSAGVWVSVVGAAGLASMLWTLLSVGVGALLGNVVGTVISLLLYTLMVENLLDLLLPQLGAHVPAFLPNQAGSGIVGSLAADDFAARIPDLPFDLRSSAVAGSRYLSGVGGSYNWWLEAIIFFVWTVIFCGLGWLVSRNRDIT